MSASTINLTRRTLTQAPQHIALLGATGGTGLEFIKHHLSIPDNTPNKPYLTLYTRPSGLSKLTSILPNINSSTSSTPAPKIRIIQGQLTDTSSLQTALSASSNHIDNNNNHQNESPNSFPQVTTVISLLGAYATFTSFFTRSAPTPITSALNTSVLPTMRSLNIKRILVLSTAASFPLSNETSQMSWSWYTANLLPRFMVPQGHAEMKGIGNAVLNNDNGILSAKEGLEGTVVRVPLVLDSKGKELKVVSFAEVGGEDSCERKAISKGSLAKWVFEEVERREWIGRAPVVCNPVAG